LSENAEVLTISRDSVLVHERWIESDPKLKWFKIKMVSDREWVLWKEIWLLHKKTWEYERVSMIVSSTWQIAYIEVCPAKIWRSMDELLRKLKALNHVVLHPELMCPESWSPWKDTVSGEKSKTIKSQFTHE
jgi:peroxiredoxin (alkyl hydroperoxide reductase subunit C)